MASIFKFIVIMMTISFFLTMIGVTTNAGYIVTKLGVDVYNHPEDIGASSFFFGGKLGSLLAILSITGVAIGLLAFRDPVSAILAAYALVLLNFGGDMVSAYLYLKGMPGNEWAVSALLVLMIPTAVGYAHAVISWWGNRSE